MNGKVTQGASVFKIPEGQLQSSGRPRLEKPFFPEDQGIFIRRV